MEFRLQGSKFIAEFEVTGDFNLHIERESSGSIYLQMKGTSEGHYDSVHNAYIADSDLIFDSDFTALVYPKYIRIVSEVEPSVAVVTFPSDVQEAIDASIVSNLNTPVWLWQRTII